MLTYDLSPSLLFRWRREFGEGPAPFAGFVSVAVTNDDSAPTPGVAVAEQEHVIGRTKLDSTELEDKADDSHVSSTDQDRFGKIFRRNMPYGTVTDHGTMFVGFSAEQRPLAAMLESMAGLAGGTRDALTLYTRPLTGAYYFVPAAEALLRLAEPPE